MARSNNPYCIGQRPRTRTILAFLGNLKGRPTWQVQCDCGKIFNCLSQDIKRQQFCKECSPTKHTPRPWKRKRPYEYLYNAFRGRAKHEVLITYEEFVALTNIKECHYCGTAVFWNEHHNVGTKKSTACNIDRKDNNLPYTLSNIAICCVACNYSKGKYFSYDEWKIAAAAIRDYRDMRKQTPVDGPDGSTKDLNK